MSTTIFSVDAFKAAMSGGGARPNQFEVEITFPEFIQARGMATISSQFLITSATLPGSTIGVATQMYRGREVHFAGDRQFAPWAITVVNDSTMNMRNAFEAWVNGMDDLKQKKGRVNPLNYQRRCAVTQLDRNNMPIKKYILNGAFPINVSDVSLDFGANDQISQFSVEMVFQDFETEFTQKSRGETFVG
jgi:T4-like virus tail tube protein gp19